MCKFCLTQAMRSNTHLCSTPADLAEATWLRFECGRYVVVTVSMPYGISGFKNVTLFPFSMGTSQFGHEVYGVFNSQEQLTDVVVRPGIRSSFDVDSHAIDKYIAELKAAQAIALLIKDCFVADLNHFLQQELETAAKTGLYRSAALPNLNKSVYQVCRKIDSNSSTEDESYKPFDTLRNAVKAAQNYNAGPGAGFNYAAITRSDRSADQPILVVQYLDGKLDCTSSLEESDNDYLRILPYLS